ncbi:Flp pilus assembly protein CpaB [Roseovarius nanhaiticus]|uniref:Flp pilus assembly protein CpaB n=1 Tax=Roseovarius nanhaiticus TaxID=573024 RepID=UPI0024935D5C|nr:Flp pilus assembly protein CpaB [Roseovarius nanhaiticus]
MRLIFGLVLILGVALAGFAVYMAKSYIQNYQTALEQERKSRPDPIKTVDIYVATRTLEYGERILMKDVKSVAFPQASLPEGTFSAEEDLFPKGDEEPRTALRAMEKGEAILAVKVTAPGQDAGISSKLGRGMRAFAIKVDSTSGVSGFLRPGDRVDVYWTGNIGRGNMRTEGDSEGDVTKLIETGVQLIAVDQSANSDMAEASIARTVTVVVRPEQVAALAQAQATGRLTLSLVGTQDDIVAERIEVDQRQLLGLSAAPVEIEAPRAEICTVRTRRGAEVIETPIPCTN